MGRYLTEQGFANIAPLLGEVVRIDADGERHALAVAQGFIRNQGDAWTWTLDLLMRGLSDLTAGPNKTQATEAEQHEITARSPPCSGAGWVRCMRCWHAIPTIRRLRRSRRRRRHHLSNGRTRRSSSSPMPSPHLMRRGNGTPMLPRTCRPVMADARPTSLRQHGGSREAGHGEVLTRIHGDLHLGQLLVANGDIYIIDFEGEPAKPVALRRAKELPRFATWPAYFARSTMQPR